MIEKLINIVTLGCSKNLVDSEHLGAQLAANGYRVTFDGGNTKAKIVIINTCGFIGDAKEESVNTILQFVKAKENGRINKLYVFGCLSERYANELRNEIPEVDNYFGAKNLKEIIEQLNAEFRNNILNERCLSTPKHYAYLKISEGCDRRCSYCAIPIIRGKFKSVEMEQLIAEAQKLARKGVKELLIVAQDTTYYGLDLYKECKLAELLNKLSKIKGIEWIRLHYAYPSKFPENVIDEIANNPKICKYIDIPFQHINNTVLKNMRRGSNGEIYEIIGKLRAKIPDIAIRTTILVGHPGEDENAFNELKKFVEETKFDRLGVFPYSEEDGTYSAKNFNNDIPEEIKISRANEIMQIQQTISNQLNKYKLGKIFKVIIDRVENEFIVARTQYDSPEVDQEILIARNENIEKIPKTGNFITVKICNSNDYDLFAEIV